MKKSFIILLIIFTYGKLDAQVNPKKMVKSQLNIVENYLTLMKKMERKNDTVTHINPDKVWDAIESLEELSGIYSERKNEFYWPNKSNFENWKGWYRKNKNRLYWNEKENKISIRK